MTSPGTAEAMTAPQVTAPLKLSFENHKHPVSRIALADIDIPCGHMKLLRIGR